MSRAKTEALEALHCQLAKTLAEWVGKTYTDKDGNTCTNAAILNVARQFLKDNGIEGVPAPNTPLKSLVDALPFPSPGEQDVTKLN